MHSPKIVVCGATGNQGGAVAAALLKSGGWSVTALTRDPGSAAAKALAELGAEVVTADLLEVDSLLRAFRGAYGVFCLTQPWSYRQGRFDTDMEIRQGKNLVWACLEAGVREVVYSSILNVSGIRSGVSYIDSKIVLEDLFSGYIPRAMIVRPALYMENIGTALLRIRGDKILGRFSGDAGVPYIALSDIGSSVAELFASPDQYTGTRSLLAGDIVTGNELALLLSGSHDGQTFRYEPAGSLWLRLTQPRSFAMRRYFELQGRLLHIATAPSVIHPLLPADPVGMAEFLKTFAPDLKR